MSTKKEPPKHADDKIAVAKLLAEHGPLPGDEATQRLGWKAERWWSVIHRSDDWFALSGEGWLLTDIGRSELDRQEG